MDLNKLTYKQKNLYLLVVSVVFFLLIYLMAFSKTIALYRQNKELEQSLARAEEAPRQLGLLEKRLDLLNRSFSGYLDDSLNSQDKILEMVSSFCQRNKLVLNELPLTNVSEESDFIVETNKAIAEGDFHALLKLLYELEYQSKIARISSASFQTSFDQKRKKTILTLTVYLQNIRIKNKES